jgi:hypothetical protein
LSGDASVVSGGTWRTTNSVGSDMSLNIYGNGLIQTRARVLEVRLRYLGSGPRTGSLILQTAGPNGVADGGGDDGNSVILNSVSLQSSASFQTLHFDLGIDHAGTPTCWLDGTAPISINLYLPGMAIGDAVEVDYIRLTEAFDWGFDSVGDLVEWQPNGNTALFATNAGVLRMQATAAGSVGMSRPFRNIGSTHFTRLEARYRSSASIQPNLLNWNYISNPAGYGAGGFQVGILANGTFETVNLDLTGIPLYGNAWGAGGGVTLNVSQGAFAAFYANAAGEFAEVDYLRLRPATTYGPSLVVAASGAPVAPNYYVSSSGGSDFNSGRSPAQPWATFTNLNGLTLGAGTTVSLKRGDTWTNRQLRLTGKGASGNPITLTAYGVGPSPIITGINVTNAACIIWDNPSHVRINSMHCKDAKVGLYLRFTGGNTDGTGPMFNNSSVQVTGCHFQNMNAVWSAPDGSIAVPAPYELSWGAGIWLGGSIPAPPGGPWPSESTLILDDFSVTHCGFQDVSTGVGMNFYFPSVNYKSRFTNFRFEDSWVTGCENGSIALFYVDGGHTKRVDTWRGGTGFYSTGTTAGFIQHCKNFVIEDCDFAGNKRNGTGNDGCGFDYEGNTENVAFRNNVIHDNDGSGMLLINSVAGNTGFAMNHNTFWNDCRNPKDAGQNNEMRASTGNSGSYSNNGIYLGAATVIGTPVVYNNSSRWQAYSGGLFNRTNTPFSSVSARPLGWEFISSVEGWGNVNQWSGFSASAGSLVGASSGADPYVESAATWVNTLERRWVRVRMSQTAGSWAQVFFQLETDATFTGDKAVSFPIIADGVVRDYIVDMGQSARYQGVVTKWRLDPTDAAGSIIFIDAFAAEANPYLAVVTSVSSRELDLRFSQAMLPSGGVFNPANYTLSGLGQGTVGAQPDSVTLIATPTGPVYRLTWNAGYMNGGPAVLSAANALDARGLPLWSGSQIAFTGINGIVPTQPPVVTATSYTASNVTLNGTNGTVGGLYYVLSTTNVALPLPSWSRLATNAFGPGGSFNVVVPVNPAELARFYRLALP